MVSSEGACAAYNNFYNWEWKIENGELLK
jgi:hypothetical protein